MAKKIKVDKTKFSGLKDLYDDGYQYIVMPKKNRSEFFATKANQKKDGSFRDASKFDSFKLEGEEEWIPSPDSKGVFIKLSSVSFKRSY